MTVGRSEQDTNRRIYSQNFLRNQAALHRMAKLAEAGEHDKIVEVGVGEGVLTEALTEHCASALAEEIDSRLVKRVKYPSAEPGQYRADAR